MGVAVFSDILNRRVKTLKLQISNPEPENAVKMPPMNPGKKQLFYYKCEQSRFSQMHNISNNGCNANFIYCPICVVFFFICTRWGWQIEFS